MATEVSRPQAHGLWFVRVNEKPDLRNKGDYKRRIDRSHFGCCSPHKGTSRSARRKLVNKCIDVEGGIFENLFFINIHNANANSHSYLTIQNWPNVLMNVLTYKDLYHLPKY